MRAFRYASARTLADAFDPDARGPDARGPDAHGPDAHGPDAHGPDAHGPDADPDEGAARAGGGTRYLAGGTDLLPLMKSDVVAPGRLLDIKRIPELRAGITETPAGVTIGALTTLAEVEESPRLARRWPALTESVAEAATPQLRNMATLGGNLLQRPRCWYFRNPRFHCWLAGGEDCPARDGENRLHGILGGGHCHAVHPSDPAGALLALDASVRLHAADGARTLGLGEFFVPPTTERRAETVLRDGELITAVLLPNPPAGCRSTYLKAMDRRAWAFALVGVAAALGLDGGRIETARLVLTGVAPVPWRLRVAERVLLGAVPADDLFARAADAALEGAAPLRRNRYKLDLARALVRRALERLASLPYARTGRGG